MATANETPPAGSERRAEFVVTLPFRSWQVDDLDCDHDVSVWRGECVCEMSGEGRCEAVSGLYYGSAEDEVTKFCPRHFFAMHGPGGAYRLVDLAEPHGEQDEADPDFVGLLPFLTAPRGDESDPDAIPFDQAVWRCSRNICEGFGDGWCALTGYFYGTGSSGEPKMCARHFFRDSGYALLDLTEEAYTRAILLDACEVARNALSEPLRMPLVRRAHRMAAAAVEHARKRQA